MVISKEELRFLVLLPGKKNGYNFPFGKEMAGPAGKQFHCKF